jgi:AcrR family transcriptional regulator
MGPENAETRSLIMDATENVMREEGYAAVTSRRVAARAGLNQQTVYYYFETMDDLLLATYRRRTAMVEEAFERAIVSEQPLHAFWRAASDPGDAVLTMEYLALSNHNDLIRQETIAFGERSRQRQVERLTPYLREGALSETVTPFGMVMTLSYVAHLLGFEQSLGLRGGHTDVARLIEAWLAGWEREALRHDIPSNENMDNGER